MNSNFKREIFSDLDREDLKFTEKDRIETFNKIQEKRHNNSSTKLNIAKRNVAPILGSVTAVTIAILVLLPNLNFGSGLVQDNSDKKQANQAEASSFSALVMGTDSTDEANHRSNINLLLTYNNNSNSMKIVQIPRDTYVDIFNSEEKMIDQDKLMNAYASETEPEAALTTVSNLFDMPVDYYAVMSEKNIYEKVELTKKAIKDDGTLINNIGNLIKEKMSASEIKSLLEKSETNIPNGALNQMKKMDTDSIQVINVAKAAKEKMINDRIYVEMNQKELDKTTNILKKHLKGN